MISIDELATIYDQNRDLCKYVHATARGHEAIQLAMSLPLLPTDFIYPYYRDDAILLGIGKSTKDLTLSVLCKKDDPFTGGRHYYGHPSVKDDDKAKVPYQSSATGMQAIPATGAAHGIKYKETQGIENYNDTPPPVVICSLGDGAITEGEVSEAFQEAVLNTLPIIYVIQDNGWGISATRDEMTAMDAMEFAKGFKGLEAIAVDGSDFIESYQLLCEVIETVRKERRPFLIHAKVPLLGHHTSGVRSEWYRDPEEFEKARANDPIPKLKAELLAIGIDEEALLALETNVRITARNDFEFAKTSADPDPNTLFDYIFAPTPIIEEKGNRTPADGKEVVMVDAALHAMDDILRMHPEALLYGQDVGGPLGGVFREAATLTSKYGKTRVFNTPIQEAYIIGSTAGMAAVGCKPVVEVQFADYIWTGLNQLFTELSRSYYLSNGKYPIQSLIRVPIGAYGSGGPFHSSSVESVLLNIRGIKVVYPSNAADMKGLFKAAFYDPNPVVMLEHKGLYWSKVPGTKAARTIEPDSDYIIPLGKARIALAASEEQVKQGTSCAVITYGRGVYWATNAAKNFEGQVEIIDLRCLEPLDWECIEIAVKKHGKVLVLTEEPEPNSFAEALTGRIANRCFQYLDQPVRLLGSKNTPCISLHTALEEAYLPNEAQVATIYEQLING